MEYGQVKKLSLSRLGMGNMRLPVVGDKRGAPIDKDRAQEIIDYAISNGVNYFDTAYVYHNGESEEFLGKALSKYPRDSYHLATKYFIAADRDYKKVFETQLKRLQTTYVDFYLIHGISDANYQKYLDCGCIEYLKEQKKNGRIKYLGFSSHASPQNLKVFADSEKWDFAQIQLNYFDWNFDTTKEEYDILAERDLPIIVMEPVRGGRLASLTPEAEAPLKAVHSDWSMASWAFRWIKTLPQVKVVLSGMSTLEQIIDNVATFSDSIALNKKETELLFESCRLFKKQIQVPCTSCRYCCDSCPSHIEIPQYLNLYNQYKVDGPYALMRFGAIESQGKPYDCISCGVCTSKCPQDINVPEKMSALCTALEPFAIKT